MPDRTANKTSATSIATTAPVAATKATIDISIVTSKSWRSARLVIVPIVILQVMMLSATVEVDATASTPIASARSAYPTTCMCAPLLP